MMIQPLRYRDGAVELLDQTKLPGEVVVLKIRGFRELARAIREMRVRGAPAIGLAAAYGVVLGLRDLKDETSLDQRFQEVVEELKRTRPTAVNLFWALERMTRAFERDRDKGLSGLKEALLTEAEQIHRENLEADRAIGHFGAELLPEETMVLTHCNTGALATGGYGTALGVVRSAWELGKLKKVLVCETRPLLQGARLTAWELEQEGIPYELITDSAAGHLMARGEVGAVIVGADRIARNGDTANKIGTYALAVLAHYHKIPFYVAAPTSTLDPSIADGRRIPLEERSPEEVIQLGGLRLAPAGAKARNPAFDVTPHRLISAIITERGVLRPPFVEAIANVLP
ncbi:MAG: S-methyl-5-thioribose-1-phosphate isomerase [Candidatus Bipolaricaulia bacterium]